LIDRTRRSVEIARVSQHLKTALRVRLEQVKPTLEEHFAVPLAKYESPQFLRYQAGDFYCRHSDGTSDPEAPDYIKQRIVSVVIFLNTTSAEPCSSSYGGGELTFYGLIRDPGFERCGLPLDAKPGMLVAF